MARQATCGGRVPRAPGVAGAIVTQLLGHNDWSLALLLAVALIAGAFGLTWFLQRPRH
jgi:hypothetical protein